MPKREGESSTFPNRSDRGHWVSAQAQPQLPERGVVASEASVIVDCPDQIVWGCAGILIVWLPPERIRRIAEDALGAWSHRGSRDLGALCVIRSLLASFSSSDHAASSTQHLRSRYSTGPSVPAQSVSVFSSIHIVRCNFQAANKEQCAHLT